VATFRIDLLFNMNEGGWSEGFYKPATDLANAISDVTSLANQRQKLKADICQIVGARVSALDVDGNPTGRGRIVDLRGTLEATPGLEARDQYTTSIRATYFDQGDVNRKRVWLRGLPDTAVAFNVTSGRPEILAAWKTKFDTWHLFLTTGGYLIKYLNPNVNVGDIQKIARLGFTTEGALRATFTVAPPAVFAAGRRVIIRKYKGALGVKVNGRTSVIEREATGALTYNKWATYCADQETMGGNAEMVKEVYSFTPIQIGVVGPPSSHKVGRPFFLQVGKARSLKGCPVTLVAPPATGSATATRSTHGFSPETTSPSASAGSLLAQMP
jgi:hypothetical protein